MSYYLKYEPTSFDELIINPQFKSKFEKMRSKDFIQPMTLYGRPGCGKSLTAKLLSDNVSVVRCDSHLAPSAIIARIENMACGRNLFSLDTRRLVVIDEIDKLHPSMQEKIRAIVDDYGKYTSFVATTNHIESVIDAVKSRLPPINFSVEKGDFYMQEQWSVRLKRIYFAENDCEPDEHVLTQAMKSFPDARHMITNLLM